MLVGESLDHGELAAVGRAAGVVGERRRLVRTAVYLLVVLTAGVYLPTPLFPGYQREFGFGDLTMTLIYATFAMVSAPVLLLFGSASNAVGSRLVLRISLVAAAFGSACFVLAQGTAWLMIGRGAQGLALGVATGAATALIVEQASVRRRLPASVLASLAFVAGTAIGPVAAGVLAQYAPQPRVLPYLLHLVLLTGGWWGVSKLPAGPARRRRLRPTRPRIPAGMRSRFAAAAASGFSAWTVAGLFLAVVPAVLARTTQVDNPAVSGVVVSGMLVCSMLGQPLVPRCGARRAQAAGLFALSVSLVALAATGGGSVSITILAAAAAGFGHGLAYGGATAAMGPVVPEHQRAEVNSALYLAFYLGSAGPAVAVGLLTFWYPLPLATSLLSVLVLALLPLGMAVVVVGSRQIRSVLERVGTPEAGDESFVRSPVSTPSSRSLSAWR